MTDRLKFELKAFEKFVLEPHAAENQQFDFKKAAKKVINAFTQAQYVQDERLFERYIQAHQSDTIRLLNVLHKQNGDCCEAASLALQEILGHIEQNHRKYFDENCSVPEAYRLMSVAQLRQDGLVLQAKLKSKEIDLNLQAEIVTYLKKLANAVSCTYKELIYAKTLMRYLLDLLSVNKASNWNRKVAVELYYLNFNKSTFFTYCRRLIAAEVDALGSFTEQNKHFNWFSRELLKLQVKPNIAYKANRTGLQELLKDYISTEKAHLAELITDNMASASALPPQTFTERAERLDFKLPLNISVPQLALFVQLFIAVGVFIVEKGQIMTIMKFFAANVTTVGTMEISAQSLNNKRKPDAVTCKWMRNMVAEMAAALDDLEKG